MLIDECLLFDLIITAYSYDLTLGPLEDFVALQRVPERACLLGAPVGSWGALGGFPARWTAKLLTSGRIEEDSHGATGTTWLQGVLLARCGEERDLGGFLANKGVRSHAVSVCYDRAVVSESLSHKQCEIFQPRVVVERERCNAVKAI